MKEFKDEKSLFIYGKKDGEGHFMRADGKSEFIMSEKISKLNPKFLV